MADSVTSGGLQFPPYFGGAHLQTAISFNTHTMTVSNAVAFIGRIYLDGKPGSKILSAAGGGSIAFRTGGVSVWTALSSLAIGIQDVDAAAGPPGRPDGAFDVSRTITSSTVTLTVNHWHTFTMGSGEKTISHGQQYAFVVRMTNRVSTDAASLASLNVSTGTRYPFVATLSAGTAWSHRNFAGPNVLFNCDDGTLGWFHGGLAMSSISSQSISSGGANTEYGLRFALPWTCHIDEVGTMISTGSSVGDYSVILYSDPDGTPATVTSIAILADNIPLASNQTFHAIPLAVPRTLTASTTYLLSVKPASTTPITVQMAQFPTAAAKLTWNGGSSLAAGARGGGAGAFSMVETNIPAGFQVRISQIQATTSTITTTTTITVTVGGAAGMVVHPGLVGGMRG